MNLIPEKFLSLNPYDHSALEPKSSRLTMDVQDGPYIPLSTLHFLSGAKL